MLLFKYKKLCKLCFICGSIGHTELFCKKKYESSEKNGERMWRSYLRAESNSTSGGKLVSKWLVGGRSLNSGGQKDDGSLFNYQSN